MAMAMAGWTAATSPVPVPSEAVATLLAGYTASPVEVELYDENEHQSGRVAIWRDGSTDEDTSYELKKLFRCRRTWRERAIAPATLAMLADVAWQYPGRPIEYVSAYRASREESRTSPHRHAAAIDFRVRGIRLAAIRDYVWRAYADVGVGWYPDGQYIHIDSRPARGDTSWTFIKGKNRYHPYWSELARRVAPESRTPARRPGS